MLSTIGTNINAAKCPDQGEVGGLSEQCCSDTVSLLLE